MSENINIYGLTPRNRSKRDFQYYYDESKRLRKEVMTLADKLKEHPKRFSIINGIEMEVEITKSDLKTIASKMTQDNKFNAIKNAMARDIEGYLEKAKYIGWRPTIKGKHTEAVYFAYYNRVLGAKSYLCMRKMRDTGFFKPYAIIDQDTFSQEIGNVRKDKPPK